MRRPSNRLTPNTVTIRRVTFGRDAAAGRARTETTDTTPYRVSVHPTSTEDRPEHMREQGVEYFTVKFYGTSPALRNRDEIITAGGLTLVVIAGRGSSAGQGMSFPVDCEYRQPAKGP